MQLRVKISLCTDGDYHLNNSEDYNMPYDCFDDDNYFGVYLFDDKDDKLYLYEDKSYLQFDTWWRACRLLEHMLTDLHVLFTHHYVLDYLYHLFDDAMKALGKRERTYYGELSGNYEGTFIEYSVVD